MSKYYTPSIEEFRVGFECQLYIPNHPVGEWINIVMDREELICLLEDGDINRYRVKYLDKEDFESLGFTLEEVEYIDKSDRWVLTHLPDSNEVELSDQQNEYEFKGIVNNKSELQMLMKMLGI